MFGNHFEHLFPSPDLKIETKKQAPKSDDGSKRQNYHINANTLSRPPLDNKNIKKEPDKNPVFYYRSPNAFMTSASSLEKIRRSMTPNLRQSRR